MSKKMIIGLGFVAAFVVLMLQMDFTNKALCKGGFGEKFCLKLPYETRADICRGSKGVICYAVMPVPKEYRTKRMEEKKPR